MQKEYKKKIWIGIAVGAVIGSITLFTLFVVFMLFFMFGGKPEVTTDVTKYEETIGNYENMKTALIVFPEQLPESAQDTDFYFYYQDTWNVPTLEVFLQCTYDEEDYQAEVQRLENTQKRYGSTVRTLLKDEEERFPFPAYIAVDGYWSSYEYALLSGERQITYIYTACKHSEYLEKVDAAYLPKDFDSRMDELSGVEGYCIYLKSVDMINGEVSAWDCDYTRDTVVQVLDYHPVTIGYNWFSVCTCLDEKDTEIIKHCSYFYYDSRHDSLYGLADEIQYAELEGYVFKAVELSEDKKRAIVTYYDGTEEKTMEYEIPEN